MTNSSKHTLTCTTVPTPQDYLDLAVILRHLLPDPDEGSNPQGSVPRTPYTNLIFHDSSDKYLDNSRWNQALRQFIKKPQVMVFDVNPEYQVLARSIYRILLNNQIDNVSILNIINTTISQYKV